MDSSDEAGGDSETELLGGHHQVLPPQRLTSSPDERLDGTQLKTLLKRNLFIRQSSSLAHLQHDPVARREAPQRGHECGCLFACEVRRLRIVLSAVVRAVLDLRDRGRARSALFV
jgi:hypothetical protein